MYLYLCVLILSCQKSRSILALSPIIYCSITGKELVQSVINGVIDGLSPFSDQSIQSSVKADQTDSPLLICACGQQPDALDDIM